MLALALAAQLVAGVVVDGTVAVEARTTQLAGTADTPGVLTGGGALRPSLAAALEREGASLALSYTPVLSVEEPQDQPFFGLNTATVRGTLPVGERYTLRASASGSAGALDAASAQAALASTRAASNDLIGAPYANGSLAVGGTGKLTRTLSVDTDLSWTGTTSPSAATQAALPSTSVGAAGAGLAWRIARQDTGLAGAEARVTNVDGRGHSESLTPTLGYRRQIAATSAVELLAGISTIQATAVIPGKPDNSTTVFLPSLAGRANARFDLAGAAALEASATAGLAAANDPLGALVENRASAGVGVAFRANRWFSCHIDAGAFTPLFQLVAPTGANADLVITTRGSVVYAVFDNAAIELAGASTTRRVDAAYFQDVSATLSFVATAPLFHSGGRPAGSDPRPGRDVGVTPVGAPPPVGAGIEEPPPLPADDEEPPPPEAALVVPPTNVPIVEQPINVRTLKRAPKADKKKKVDDKAPDAATPPGAPTGPPAPAAPSTTTTTTPK